MPIAEPAAHDASVVSRVLAQGYRRLRFPEPLEGEFRRDHLLGSRRWVRLSLFVAFATSAGFAVIDPWIVHAAAPLPRIVRFGVQLPALLVILLATFERFYVRWYELAIQIGVPAFGIGTIVVAGYAQPQYASLVGARLLLVCFYFYFLAGLRMPQALRGNVVILGALVAAGLADVLPADLATFLAISLLSANLIGAAGAYSLEHARRTAFLERKLLVEIAELDGLTQLMNRHTFESRARAGWRSASTVQQSVTILMIDVDHFKLYNDHYGHQAGDDCLRRVAETVRSALARRPGDLIARYGGEEIIALLIDRKPGELQDIAQHVVLAVNALALPHAASSWRLVSVSVGAATQFPPLAGSFDALVKHADGALYAAKHQGRNRAIVVEMRASAAA
jgi:diguanylate cyclase (GGDEF)-like protein